MGCEAVHFFSIWFLALVMFYPLFFFFFSSAFSWKGIIFAFGGWPLRLSPLKNMLSFALSDWLSILQHGISQHNHRYFFAPSYMPIRSSNRKNVLVWIWPESLYVWAIIQNAKARTPREKGVIIRRKVAYLSFGGNGTHCILSCLWEF